MGGCEWESVSGMCVGEDVSMCGGGCEYVWGRMYVWGRI